MDIKKELEELYGEIKRRTSSFDLGAMAIMYLARAKVLEALQKYEENEMEN